MNRPWLTIVLLIIIGCDQKTPTKLDGVWYSCNRDGTYQEIHFAENNFEIFFEDVPSMSFKFFYKLSNDTLIFSRQPLQNNELPQKAYLTYNNETSLIWDNLSEPLQSLEMRKTNFMSNFSPYGSDKEFDIWLKDFEKEFNLRIAQANCPDLRSRDEIIEDSLMQLHLDTALIIDDNFEDIDFN